MTINSEGGLYRQFGVNAFPLVSEPTFVLGTAYQPCPDRDCFVYVFANSTAGAVLNIDIGPDDTTALNLFVTNVAATGLGSGVVKLPAGWWIKVEVQGDLALSQVVVITD